MALTPAASRKGRPPVIRVPVPLPMRLFERAEAAAHRAGLSVPAWLAELADVACFRCEHIARPAETEDAETASPGQERSSTWPPP